MEKISLSNIKQLYPNEWVLIGNPAEVSGELFGEVIIHDKDKKKLATNVAKTQQQPAYNKTILRYTGELPIIGKWLKFIQ
jgi:hypothetical protein